MSEKPKMIPPDLNQCQAEVTVSHPFRMGGDCRETTRCSAKPTVVLHETEPAEAGMCGSMSLCSACLAVFRQQCPDAAVRVEYLKPPRIEHGVTA